MEFSQSVIFSLTLIFGVVLAGTKSVPSILKLLKPVAPKFIEPLVDVFDAAANVTSLTTAAFGLFLALISENMGATFLREIGLDGVTNRGEGRSEAVGEVGRIMAADIKNSYEDILVFSVFIYVLVLYFAFWVSYYGFAKSRRREIRWMSLLISLMLTISMPYMVYELASDGNPATAGNVFVLLILASLWVFCIFGLFVRDVGLGGFLLHYRILVNADIIDEP